MRARITSHSKRCVFRTRSPFIQNLPVRLHFPSPSSLRVIKRNVWILRLPNPAGNLFPGSSCSGCELLNGRDSWNWRAAESRVQQNKSYQTFKTTKWGSAYVLGAMIKSCQDDSSVLAVRIWQHRRVMLMRVLGGSAPRQSACAVVNSALGSDFPAPRGMINNRDEHFDWLIDLSRGIECHQSAGMVTNLPSGGSPGWWIEHVSPETNPSGIALHRNGTYQKVPRRSHVHYSPEKRKKTNVKNRTFITENPNSGNDLRQNRTRSHLSGKHSLSPLAPKSRHRPAGVA